MGSTDRSVFGFASEQAPGHDSDVVACVRGRAAAVGSGAANVAFVASNSRPEEVLVGNHFQHRDPEDPAVVAAPLSENEQYVNAITVTETPVEPAPPVATQDVDYLREQVTAQYENPTPSVTASVEQVVNVMPVAEDFNPEAAAYARLLITQATSTDAASETAPVQMMQSQATNPNLTQEDVGLIA